MHIVFPYDGYEHLGIGYLASVARAAGHSVALVPLNLGDYIRGRKQMNEKRFQRSVAAIISRKPDAVAFSLNSYMADDYSRIASMVRAQGIVTVAGGPHATAEPVMTLESGAFDGLITHEAEAVFTSALEYLRQKAGPTPQWLFTEEHLAAVHPPLPELDVLPFPAKDLFYRNTPFEADDYKIITSRGCPFGCIFCAHSAVADGPLFRRRRIDAIIDELVWAKRQFHPSSVYFLDDIFTVNTAWLRDFLRAYREEIGLPFHAISHPSCFTDEAAEMLKHAGCVKIRMGVQSLTPRIKRYLGRPEKNEQVIEAIAAANRHKISLEVDHLVNIPGETLEEGREAITIYNHHRPDAIKVYWLVPLPGSRLFSEARDKGLISDADANDIRRGKGFGSHSYLFYAKKKYSDRRWLGIHFLLSFLTLMPRPLVTLLVKIRFDRFIRIPSFTLMVGLPRVFRVFSGKDRVIRDHVRRLMRRPALGKHHSHESPKEQSDENSIL